MAEEDHDLEERLNRIFEILVSFASLDFTVKASISNKHDTLDSIAMILNSVGEDLHASTVSKDYLDLIMGSMMDVLIVTDHYGFIRKINQAACDMLGYNETELIGKSISFVLDHKLASDRSITENLVQSTFISKGGDSILISLSCSSMSDTKGKPAGIIFVAHDITKQKADEDALKASEERYRAFISQSPAAIWRLEAETPIPTDNPEGDQIQQWYQRLYVDEANDALVRQYGLTMKDFIGMRLDSFMPHSNHHNIDIIRQFIRSNYQLVNVETHEKAKNGDDKYFLNNWTGIVEDGRLIRVWGAQRDITDRKYIAERLQRLNEELEQRVIERTAELQASNHELDAFAFSVSHDLRAPLRSIAGFSQAVLEDYHDKLDADGQEFLHDIVQSVQKMNTIISDILHLSRVTRSDLIYDEFDLSELVQSNLNDLQKADRDRQVNISIQMDVMVYADERLLNIVFINLLSNAWKFIRHTHKPEIEFSTRQQDGETIYVVRDNGAGFDMTYADKLFGAFQRLHRDDEYEGTGIGLATVQRVIRKHGGRIWAEAAVGQGASFYFTLHTKS